MSSLVFLVSGGFGRSGNFGRLLVNTQQRFLRIRERNRKEPSRFDLNINSTYSFSSPFTSFSGAAARTSLFSKLWSMLSFVAPVSAVSWLLSLLSSIAENALVVLPRSTEASLTSGTDLDSRCHS